LANPHMLPNAKSAPNDGPEFVHLKADDPVPALLDFARSHGVGQLIVGRSRAPWWRQLLGRTIAMRLVKEADGLDVLIAAIEDEPQRQPAGPLREPSAPAPSTRP
jgi:two-component system sensor histidine kinase KdpD